MTINLTELRDEPLGKHPIQAAYCYPNMCYISGIDVEQDVVASDHEILFNFDVDGLSDEALHADARFVGCLACLASLPAGGRWTARLAHPPLRRCVVPGMRNPI